MEKGEEREGKKEREDMVCISLNWVLERSYCVCMYQISRFTVKAKEKREKETRNEERERRSKEREEEMTLKTSKLMNETLFLVSGNGYTVCNTVEN